MSEKMAKLITDDSIVLSDRKHVMIDDGIMYIFDRNNVWGTGYRLVTTFTFDDFDKMKKLAEKESERIAKKYA